MKPLDITNPETWPTAVTQLVRDAIMPLLGDEKVLDDVFHKLDNNDSTDLLVKNLIRESREIMKYIPSFIAYHSCRPLDVICYKEKGLLVATKPRLREMVQKYVGDMPGWEDAYEKAFSPNGIQDYLDDWYDGQAGLSFTPLENYGKKGSHFLGDVLEELGAIGQERRREIFKRTRPTLLVCELPLDWVLGSETEGDLLGVYVRELLRAEMEYARGRKSYQSILSIHLCRDLPPERIVDVREG